MAYLQVTRDGDEWISNEPLIRYPQIEIEDKRIKKRKQCLSITDQYCWTWPYTCYENIGEMVLLPQGTIEKLIGKKLTFEDEPYEII